MQYRSARSGYILVTVAILLVVLLAFVSLAIDVGLLYGARTQSQIAADAGALAGAVTFVLNPMAPQPATAEARARSVAAKNRAMAGLIDAAEVTAVADVANRRVVVDINRNEPTLFAKAFNLSSVAVHTRAVAEAADHSTGAGCVKPFFIPNTVAAPEVPCGPGGACALGHVLIAGDEKTAWAETQLGQQFRLKPQGPTGAIAPGDFYGIEISGPGGSDFRDAIATCLASYELFCRNSYSVKTGNMVGPTKQGVDTLVGDPPEYTYVNIGQYRRVSDMKVFDTAPGLAVAPIVDLCNFTGFCPGNKLPSGTNPQLSVLGFALIFIEGIQSGGPFNPFDKDVVARLLDVSSCGDVADPPMQGATVLSIPIRLVRLP
jgi:hypothetical protein